MMPGLIGSGKYSWRDGKDGHDPYARFMRAGSGRSGDPCRGQNAPSCQRLAI